MWKFLTALFVIVVSTSLIAAGKAPFCDYQNPGICTVYGKIPSVKRMVDRHDNYLQLSLDNVIEIVPWAFQETNINVLVLGSYSKKCGDETIESTRASFDGLSSLQSLTLDCVVFTKTSNLFEDLVSLKELNIINIEFTKLPDNFLSYLSKLRKLLLSRVRSLDRITPNTFSGINPGLQELHFASNNLKVVEAQSFQKLHELKILEISNNELTVLSPDMFDGLHALKKLILSNNKISVIRNNTFSKLSQLTFVNLDGNKLRKIEVGTFSGSLFQYIYLGWNELEDLSIGMFKNLLNLEELFLNDNKISLLRRGVFEGPKKLLNLDLSYNNINRIEPYAFRKLNIFKLDLKNNKLNIIEHDTFNGLHIDNGKLDLSDNEIVSIEEYAFRNLTKTEKADIILPKIIPKK